VKKKSQRTNCCFKATTACRKKKFSNGRERRNQEINSLAMCCSFLGLANGHCFSRAGGAEIHAHDPLWFLFLTQKSKRHLIVLLELSRRNEKKRRARCQLFLIIAAQTDAGSPLTEEKYAHLLFRFGHEQDISPFHPGDQQTNDSKNANPTALLTLPVKTKHQQNRNRLAHR
jgi:hypothetical protein